jgi:hypothetical protein
MHDMYVNIREGTYQSFFVYQLKHNSIVLTFFEIYIKIDIKI